MATQLLLHDAMNKRFGCCTHVLHAFILLYDTIEINDQATGRFEINQQGKDDMSYLFP